jgi:hypothetical protein
VVVVVGRVKENDCVGGGCLELSICECLDGRTDGRRNVESHKAIQESLNKY